MRTLSEFRGIHFDADEIILVDAARDTVYNYNNTVVHSFTVVFSQGTEHRFEFDSFEDAEVGRCIFVDQFCRVK